MCVCLFESFYVRECVRERECMFVSFQHQDERNFVCMHMCATEMGCGMLYGDV